MPDWESRRDRILQALYATAIEPGEHERFIDEWNAALDVEYFDSVGEDHWIESHLEKALSIFERLEFEDSRFSSLNEVVTSQISSVTAYDNGDTHGICPFYGHQPAKPYSRHATAAFSAQRKNQWW